jgi:hypothetical protein
MKVGAPCPELRRRRQGTRGPSALSTILASQSVDPIGPVGGEEQPDREQVSLELNQEPSVRDLSRHLGAHLQPDRYGRAKRHLAEIVAHLVETRAQNATDDRAP